MTIHANNPFYAHYEAGASSYESINSFKKDIVRQLLELCPVINEHSTVLDNACGPGIVTGEIQNSVTLSKARQIHAVDFSPKMIDELNQKVMVEKWTHVDTAVMDAENLTFEDNKFTHSITNYGIFLFPDPVRASTEIYRTLQPGCVAVVTSWSGLGWLDILQKVQLNVKPEATLWGGPFAAWMGTSKLEETMLAGGFQPGKMRVVSLRTILLGEDRDVYLEAMKPVWRIRATQDWSDSEKCEFEKQLDAVLEGLKTNNTNVELITSVAIAEK